ncbi:MAG: RsmB/NOP family class I SAM-dependent RNA methyltransferase [Frankiaceae bacterium]
MGARRAAAPGRPVRVTGQPRRHRPRTDPARRAAHDALRMVDERDAYANLVLPALLAQRRLTGRDAAFATELVHGTLRARGRLDAVVARCVDRPLADVDPPVLDLLRLGAYQLLETRVPAHAAVSASVDLARAVLGAGPARFVNAVLRRVAERDLAGWLAVAAPPYDADPVGHLEVVTSHPRWVVSALRDALGGDLDETRRALDADNERPQVHLAARPGRIDRDALLGQAGPGARPGPFSPFAVHLSAGGDPAAIQAVRDGRAGAQDEGSQLAALALAHAPLAGPDRTWVDLCAGPGGKAALLAGLLAGRAREQARLLAVEPAAHRARLVARALAGGPAGTLVIQADGTGPLVRPGSADRVLVDAPCSGLGALRRRPEARWRRVPADLPPLGRLQRELLRRAVELLRPGGVVAYVTCSPHVAETRAVVDDVVGEVAGLEPIDAAAVLAGLGVDGAALDAPPGTVQLWPHRHGTDAMFVALLRAGSP